MTADALVRHFASAPEQFPTSPLYGRLGTVVAADERLLALAANGRPGQRPANLLLAAVHYLLLCDPAHELAGWYPSLGGHATGDPGPAFTDFCLSRSAEITEVTGRRLVQTNVVKRAAALRLGLAEVATMTDEPVTLIEVGCSAGVHLRFDEYRYEIAGRTWGRASSPVVVRTAWRGANPPPDLDRLPGIADRCGVDLHPIDAGDPDERRWLRALIWPENTAHAELQDAALRVVAGDPPRTVTGDAVEVLPELVAAVPKRTPAVVFHAATRLHVPAGRREGFDAAIAGVARDHRLFHLSFEAYRGEDEPVFALTLGRGDGTERLVGTGDGHAEWLSA
jgi:hypothetical protein